VKQSGHYSLLAVGHQSADYGLGHLVMITKRLPSVFINIEFHSQHQSDGIDAQEYSTWDIQSLWKVLVGCQVIRVKLVDLDHGLNACIASFG